MNYLNEFKLYREAQNISVNTIDMEIRYLTKFHTFFNVLKKQQVPVWDITFNDVKTFFDEESKNLSDRTIYRKITIISLYFDFLWRKGHIPIDFMEKFRKRYRKLEWELSEINIDYQMMLDKKNDILSNHEINLMPKLIYLLMLRGVTMADMLSIQINDILVLPEKVMIIFETKKDSVERTLVYSDPLDIEILTEGIQLAEIRGINYLISSKSEGVYTTFNPVNLHDMVRPIEKILGFSIKSTHKVIYAYAYYLANVKKKNINEISILLGTSQPHTLKVLKTALERIGNISYNEIIK